MVQTQRQHLITQKHLLANCVFHKKEICLIKVCLLTLWFVAGLASPVVVQRVE